MRLIGHLPDQTQADRFGDYLLVQGIKTDVEPDDSGRWAIWVHDEDQLELAGQHLKQFRNNPEAAAFQKAPGLAHKMRSMQEKEAEDEEKRHFDRRRLLYPVGGRSHVIPVTFILIGISLVVGILTALGDNMKMVAPLLISEYVSGPGILQRLGQLDQVYSGQVWRLLTPIFLHFGIIHLAFNMLWLYDLGGMIESRQGSGRLLQFVIVAGVFSNLAEYLLGSPNPLFGGMSGVVYGLLGYVWLRGKFDLTSGLYLHPQIVVLMIVWFFLCWSGFIGNIANYAHTFGLLIGMAWGYLSAQMVRG